VFSCDLALRTLAQNGIVVTMSGPSRGALIWDIKQTDVI
jgi:hypothetical protein